VENNLKISILCSDDEHPVNSALAIWINRNKVDNEILLAWTKNELKFGDILFLVSCNEIIDKCVRDKFKATLVLHASDLPEGRGWSPHIWKIIEGSSEIVVSLIEAEDAVDSGRIWRKNKINVPKHALWDEINALIFDAELDLMDFAIQEYFSVEPYEQSHIPPSYYPKRSPGDSRLDPSHSIESLFNQIRVCDPTRFPAKFELFGQDYKIILKKIGGQKNDY